MMGDFFLTKAEANEFASQLQKRGRRALGPHDRESANEDGLYRTISPDLDFTRPDRTWGSVDEAISHYFENEVDARNTRFGI